MKREVDAPEQEFLTAEEAAKWLRVETEDFLEFVKMEVVPPGVPFGKRKAAQRWPWMDIVAVAYLLGRGFLKPPGEK